MFDRRLIKDFEWPTLFFTFSLAGLGVLGVYSASRTGEGIPPLFMDHLLRLGIGGVALLLVLVIDYHLLVRHAYAIFFLNTAALVLVEFVGHVGMGAQRWLFLAGFRVQPSEFLKITLVLLLARFFSGLKKPPPYGLRDLFPTLAAVALPFLLVLKQPDLGTALVIAGIYVIVVFLAGADLKIYLYSGAALLGTAGVFALLAVLKIFNVLSLLRDYQIRRLKVLFDPGLDPLGAGYHINQSKIAIGSGGLAGKGFLHGTQSGLKFLPQQHTDFIFSVLAEEGGILVGILVLGLMLGLLYRGVHCARQAQDRQGTLLALGVVAVLFLHFAVNIGMTTGILPVVGLPLPLLSYGGSSVIATMVGIGLVMNVRMRRFVF